ncbi:DUF2793 domain-containing protein [Plastorhodobacter daqingensis]|uniref:DUF2793 domain-containing protein n=1 Tax=Plastorhodobacter daqingensis TaxID=1387281 RepID=A0ABW2ULR6_9RHOB
MTETVQMGLPLVQPAQAQKHVTVNEAFTRLDALAKLVIVSRTVVLPPVAATEGQVWAVPQGAVNDWEGQGGKLALFQNGGWSFVSPRPGWTAWIAAEHMQAVFDGAAWRSGAVALSPARAGSFFRVSEFDHPITAGSSSQTSPVVPAGTMLLAVTARVLAPITGTLTGWQLGNPGALNRFGSGLGLQTGSWARGLLSTPMSFYENTPLVLTATGGSFTGGEVRIALHLFEVGLPSP